MQYVVLGQSGLLVSEVSLGTMTFGRETSEDESIRILERYLEVGSNFIDTANVYSRGIPESILGQALKGKREGVVVATKVSFRMGEGIYECGASRKHIMRAVEESLKRLQTDYIDLYQIHCFDRITPLEETFATLASLVEKGYVRYIGVSNYTGWQITKAVAFCERWGYPHPISAQMQYSLVERNIEMEVIPTCYDTGLSIMAWGPLGGGFLTGKYSPETPPEEGRIAHAEKDWEEAGERRATEKNFRILEAPKNLPQNMEKRFPRLPSTGSLQRKTSFRYLVSERLHSLRTTLDASGAS